MTDIIDIINELNLQNGSNHKISVLKKHKENETLKRVLSMTHDGVSFTYGVSMRHWNKGEGKEQIFNLENEVRYTLKDALDFMEFELATRNVTGNEAIARMHDIFCGLNEGDTIVATRVLGRDLRINAGLGSIKKVFPGLIKKPVYMRCGIYNKGSAKDIKFPAYIQLKADGTYREAFVSDGKVEFFSRSGEQYEYPVLAELLKDAPDGHYTGELIVRGTSNRSESNGLINSDNPPHDKIDFFVWDYITNEEYTNAWKKIPNKITYEQRFAKLNEIFKEINSENLQIIESHEVKNISEALALTTEWMENGLEGGVLKDKGGVYRDGTSKYQLKLKLEIDIEVRIVGFQEGTPGTAREKTFGAMLFETDDGMIKGRTSGFTDAQLQDFNSRRAEMIGKIITVQFNDVTKARHSDHYSLSHPRFIEVRNDKNETDTLERALEAKQMAMDLS